MYIAVENNLIKVSIPAITSREDTTTLQKIFICTAELIKNNDNNFINFINEYWTQIDEETINKYKRISNDIQEKQCFDGGSTKRICSPDCYIPSVSDDKEMG